MALKAREAWYLALRSLFLQVLFNYRTMQGAGYLFALWPWLRASKQSPERVRASADYLNAHPVFAALAIGAMRRRIEDGDVQKDPGGFSHWQDSLSGPLGSIGDALIWDRWKPLLFGTSVLLLMWKPYVELWAVVAVACILLYNLPLFYLRYWGVRTGYRLGAHVLDALNNPALTRIRHSLNLAGATVAGLLLAMGLLSAGVMHGGTVSVFHALQFLAAFAVMLTGIRRYWPFLVSVLLSLAAATILPMILGSIIH